MGIFSKKKFLLKFSENHPMRCKIMQKIDCAHSRSVKMLHWSWFREIDVRIEAKIEKFWNFSLKIIFLGVISCGESIARIPEAWKGFSAPDSGKWVFLLKRKYASGMRWIDFSHKITLRTMILEEKSKIFIFSLQCTHLFPWIRVKEAFSRFGNARNRFFA